jgi:hypothetical protein
MISLGTNLSQKAQHSDALWIFEKAKGTLGTAEEFELYEMQLDLLLAREQKKFGNY